MARAYYRLLNREPSFQRELRVLFEDWSGTAVDGFTRRWPLPKKALSDLAWSRDLWRNRLGGEPRMEVGLRSYPGIEDPVDSTTARRLGYVRFPPPLQSPSLLDRGALRLYRRACLRFSWSRIAQVESRERLRPEIEDVKAVYDSVHRWARSLGIALPNIPVGRPTKRRGA